jgi:hypothetical protein
MRSQSQQAMLDSFFGSLGGAGQWLRMVSDRAFAKARDRLSWNCLEKLNTFVVQQADSLGLVPRWQGLRLVAADASVLMPCVRPCLTRRYLAGADQRLFCLYLPGAELTLHASVHGAQVGERQMLFEALSHLGPDDMLLLDRGYPASWLVAYLNEHNIRFCMRCDVKSGWTAQRRFVRSDKDQEVVTLPAPAARDVQDYGCSSQAPQVRFVRCIGPQGQVRVMATNLPLDVVDVAAFTDLYHQRWRIEEAFKRIKHRCKLESVSGLTQHALLVDVFSKVLADNLASLVANAAITLACKDSNCQRRCNRSYAAQCLQRHIPRMLLALGDIGALLRSAFALLAANTVRHDAERKRPRPKQHRKPHPSMAYKA